MIKKSNKFYRKKYFLSSKFIYISKSKRKKFYKVLIKKQLKKLYSYCFLTKYFLLRNNMNTTFQYRFRPFYSNNRSLFLNSLKINFNMHLLNFCILNGLRVKNIFILFYILFNKNYNFLIYSKKLYLFYYFIIKQNNLRRFYYKFFKKNRYSRYYLQFLKFKNYLNYIFYHLLFLFFFKVYSTRFPIIKNFININFFNYLNLNKFSNQIKLLKIFINFRYFSFKYSLKQKINVYFKLRNFFFFKIKKIVIKKKYLIKYFFLKNKLTKKSLVNLFFINNYFLNNYNRSNLENKVIKNFKKKKRLMFFKFKLLFKYKRSSYKRFLNILKINKIKTYFYFLRFRILKNLINKKKLSNLSFISYSYIKQLIFQLNKNTYKKINNLILFVGRIRGIFYNSTFKQYNFLFDIGFKNIILLPFLSIFNILSTKFKNFSVVMFNNKLLEYYFLSLNFLKIISLKLKKIKIKKLILRKKLNYFFKSVFLSKKKFNFFKKFNFKFLNNNFFSNKFLININKTVYTSILLNYNNSLFTYAWRDVKKNYIENNSKIFKFLNFKKLKILNSTINLLNKNYNFIFDLNKIKLSIKFICIIINKFFRLNINLTISNAYIYILLFKYIIKRFLFKLCLSLIN